MVKKIGGCRFKRTAAASWFEEGVLIKSSYYGDVVIDLDGEEVNDIHSFGPAPKFLSNKLTWLIFNIRTGGLKLKNYRFYYHRKKKCGVMVKRPAELPVKKVAMKVDVYRHLIKREVEKEKRKEVTPFKGQRFYDPHKGAKT